MREASDAAYPSDTTRGISRTHVSLSESAVSGILRAGSAKQVEPWSRAWARRLFEDPQSPLPLGEPDLWADLDEDPTAVRRLFLLDNLLEDSGSGLQMLVGAMDLLESLAKDSDSAVSSKSRLAFLAVSAGREFGDPTTRLGCLRLIEDRLQRTSFSRVQDSVGPALVDAVTAHTLQYPEITMRSSALSSESVALNESWFGRGVIEGFQVLAHDEPDKLLSLGDSPLIIRVRQEVGR